MKNINPYWLLCCNMFFLCNWPYPCKHLFYHHVYSLYYHNISYRQSSLQIYCNMIYPYCKPRPYHRVCNWHYQYIFYPRLLYRLCCNMILLYLLPYLYYSRKLYHHVCHARHYVALCSCDIYFDDGYCMRHLTGIAQ